MNTARFEIIAPWELSDSYIALGPIFYQIGARHCFHRVKGTSVLGLEYFVIRFYKRRDYMYFFLIFGLFLNGLDWVFVVAP